MSINVLKEIKKSKQERIEAKVFTTTQNVGFFFISAFLTMYSGLFDALLIVAPILCFSFYKYTEWRLAKKKFQFAADGSLPKIVSMKTILATIGFCFLGYFWYATIHAYQDYSARAKLQERLTLMIEASQAIDKFRDTNGRSPASLNEVGFDIKDAQITFSPQTEELLLTTKPNNIAFIANRHMLLSKSGNVWKCSGDIKPHFIRGRFLPLACEYTENIAAIK